MTVLGLDVGERRIGIAISDPMELIARPLIVLFRKSNLIDCAELGRIVAQHDVRTIVVGLPLSSDDKIGEQARRTLAFARYLRRHLAVPIVTWDERYTTVAAQQRMVEQGIGKARRRQMIDSAAAAIILDEWLTGHRSEGRTTVVDRPPDPL